MELIDVEFSENPDPRCACVLLLDTSGSMSRGPIQALNEGLKIFSETLVKDSLAARRVEVAVISFDSDVKLIQDFVTADQFHPPVLTASGGTDMAGGINMALDAVRKRKETYNANKILYYRPWIFMITDGGPNSGFEVASNRLKAEEKSKAVAFFSAGVEGADMAKLAEVSERAAPLSLKGLNFKDMFIWLSASMKGVSNSRTDEQIALPPPRGWTNL